MPESYSVIPPQLWILIGLIAGASITYFTQRHQMKPQGKREEEYIENKKEVTGAYKRAVESLYSCLDVVQQGFIEDILDNKSWRLKERLARIELWRCIADLRMLGEDDIADGCAVVMDYMEERDERKLKEEWEEIILNRYVHPLLEKVNQRLKWDRRALVDK